MSKIKKGNAKGSIKRRVQKTKQRKRTVERLKKINEEGARYTLPAENSEKGREECRKRLEEGKICYCKERCGCRSCQERSKELGSQLCGLEDLKQDGGCAYGCSECLECSKCY